MAAPPPPPPPPPPLAACPANQGLADRLAGLLEALPRLKRYKESWGATIRRALRSVCDADCAVATIRDFQKLRRVAASSRLAGVGAWVAGQVHGHFKQAAAPPPAAAAGASLAAAAGEPHQASHPAARQRASKPYKPGVGTAPFALLITLYRRKYEQGDEYMLKEALIDETEASSLSTRPIRPTRSEGSVGTSSRRIEGSFAHYSGWSSMSLLVSKGLIGKTKRPARYQLTEAGEQLARDCMRQSEDDQFYNLLEAENSPAATEHGYHSSHTSHDASLQKAKPKKKRKGTSVLSDLPTGQHDLLLNENHSRAQATIGKDSSSADCSSPDCLVLGEASPKATAAHILEAHAVPMSTLHALNGSTRAPLPRQESQPDTQMRSLFMAQSLKQSQSSQEDPYGGYGHLEEQRGIPPQSQPLLRPAEIQEIMELGYDRGQVLSAMAAITGQGCLPGLSAKETVLEHMLDLEAVPLDQHDDRRATAQGGSSCWQEQLDSFIAGTNGSSDPEPAQTLSLPPLRLGQCLTDVYDIIFLLDNREQYMQLESRENERNNNLRSRVRHALETHHVMAVEVISSMCFAFVAHKCFRSKETSIEYVLDFIIERKSVVDLSCSILGRDNRYMKQKLRMKRSGLTRPMYLVEGNADLMERSEAIKTACLETEALDNFDIQRTVDLMDTVRRYGYLTRAVKDRYSHKQGGSSQVPVCMTFAQFEQRVKDFERRRISDVFALMLLQVNGVTEDIAQGITRSYPTVHALVKAYMAREGDQAAQEKLLVGIPYQGKKDKSITETVSRKVFTTFWSRK
eukprot:SM000099S25249  [mRNA]  locus=s99:451343:456528:- [translate_table: standard]